MHSYREGSGSMFSPINVMRAGLKTLESKKRYLSFQMALIPLILCSCANTSRGKAIQAGIIGAAIGGIYGSTRNSFKDQNSMMYGAIGATVGTAAGLYYFHNNEEEKKLREENQKLKNSIDDFERRLSEPISQQGLFNGDPGIPDEYRSLIRSGIVRMYKLNKWDRESKNRIVFKTDAIEVVESPAK